MSQLEIKSPPMYPNKKTKSDNRSPTIDIDFDDTTSAATDASTMNYISNRG